MKNDKRNREQAMVSELWIAVALIGIVILTTVLKGHYVMAGIHPYPTTLALSSVLEVGR